MIFLLKRFHYMTPTGFYIFLMPCHGFDKESKAFDWTLFLCQLLLVANVFKITGTLSVSAGKANNEDVLQQLQTNR